MNEKMKTIISASRRTDVPAFYYEWLQEVLKDEVVLVANQYSDKKLIVELSPDKIHSIVLWSKDYRKVAQEPGYLDNYNSYFQYTITNYSKFMEPYTPDYVQTLKTLEIMLKRYKPEQFNIRFDPIIISNMGEKEPTPEKPGLARLKAFETLCRDLKSLGMDKSRITTSYISLYGHVAKKIEASGLDIVNLTEEQQCKFVERMVEIADKYAFTLYSCSNPILEGVEAVKKSHCIDGELLVKLFGGRVSKSTSTGQREACGCSKSVDIGGYGQKCGFACRYCYATK